jgi:DNA-binding NarL/FixJ family response regulator
VKANQAKKRARILIVDDHPAVREALALRIGRQADLEVCGEAADMAEALRLVTETQPDLAVIDISLKTGSGIDLIKRIKDRNDSVRMLVWSMHSEALYAERALRAGAMGYVNKDQATDRIIEAIDQVLAGKIYISGEQTELLLNRVVGGPAADRPLVEKLSDRELEAFELMGQGLTTESIAEKMHVSPKTIETYRARIKDKLGLTNVNELIHRAVLWAAEKG